MAFIGPFTKRFVNPIMRRVAGHLPWFAILTFRGRRSGKTYRTPMNVFRHGSDYVFALTYSSDVQWVKSVLAAGECQIKTLGRTIRLTDPQLVVDPKRRLVPLPVRLFLGPLRVTEFIRMRPALGPEDRIGEVRPARPPG